MKEFLSKRDINFKESVPLSVLTGMNVSGTLPLVAYPDSEEKLLELYTKVVEEKLSFDVIGCLTNTYLANNYQRDLVIVTTKVREVGEPMEGFMWVGCGYGLTSLAKELSSKGITGFEGFVGIPGTVGAAAINNSGAFNASMANVVEGVRISRGGGSIFLNNNELHYSQRSSILKGSGSSFVLLAVKFRVNMKDNLCSIEDRIHAYTEERKKKIDGRRKSLGSVFVSSSMKEIRERHKFATISKKIANVPFKLLGRNDVNTYLDFLFYGKPSMAKHCDSFNRFCWDKDTKEEDFMAYIKFMQKLAGGKLRLEVEIKR